MEVLSFLVIGAGAIGRRHSSNIRQLGHNCEIVSFRRLEDLEMLLTEGKFDGVVVATASQVRLEVLRPCAQRLIPMYIEKPLAFDNDVLNEIYAFPKTYLKTCFAGFMMRFHPLTKFALGIDYSDAYSFSFEIGYDVNLWRPDWKFSASYASKPAGGGVLLDLCHEIDLASLFFSPIRLSEVTCLGHREFVNVDFFSHVTFTNSSNLIGSVSMDYLSSINHRRLVIKGVDYIDEIDFLAGCYKRTSSTDIIVRDFTFDRNQLFLDAMRSFIGRVLGEKMDSSLLPSLDQVKSSCELISNAWSSRKFVGFVEREML
jgi:predicted dehydrogenase